MEKLTLEFTTDQFLSKEEIYTRFFAPVSRFIKENGLGELDEYLEHDPGNIFVWIVRSPVEAADLEESKSSAWVDIRHNGTAKVYECEFEGKTFLEGTWIEAAKWVIDFYKDVAQQNQKLTEQVVKLSRAAAILQDVPTV